MKDLTQHRLNNGLTLLVREARTQPVVTVDAWVDTGSINEPAAINGISHFLEHMLFKGTEKYAPKVIDRLVEDIGGYWNAGTSKDYTHYYCTVATPFRETAMDVVSDILRNAKLDAAELDRERLVILEEWKRKQDEPDGLLWEEVYFAAFDESPYRPTILGEPDTIKAIDATSMRDYFERYYAPQNLRLVVVGDISAADAIDLAEKYFGDWGRTYRPLDTTHKSKRAAGNRRVMKRDVKETYAAISFPGPDATTEADLPAADALEIVLGRGDASRLHQRLVEREQVVHGVDVGTPGQKSDGLFFVTAALDDEHYSKFKNGSLEEIRKFQSDGPTAEEMQRAKTMIYNQTVYSRETTSGTTSQIGYLSTLTGSTDFLVTYLDRLAAVTAEDLVRVATSYLNPAMMNEAIITPKESSLN